MRKFSKISIFLVSLVLSVQFTKANNPLENTQDQYSSVTDDKNNRYNSNFSSGSSFLANDKTKYEINTNASNADQNSSFDIFENNNAAVSANNQEFSNQAVQGNFENAANFSNEQFHSVNAQNQTGSNGSVDKTSQQSVVAIKSAPAAKAPNSSDVPDNGTDPVDTPINSAVFVLFAIAAFFGFKSKLVIEKKS